MEAMVNREYSKARAMVYGTFPWNGARRYAGDIAATRTATDA